MIFNIQRFSTHDGSGIRTIIFYKGCTLKCQWCSNPESQSFEPEILFDSQLCRKFGDCTLISPALKIAGDRLVINRAEIDATQLSGVCASRAITVAGENLTAEKLLHEIEKDSRFFDQSGGGVTLSGGEPLAQGLELVMLLQALRQKGIDTAVETSLHVPWPKISRFLSLINTWLVDLKHTDSAKFREFTGGDLIIVIRNLQKLTLAGVPLIVRIPVIPGFNHTLPEIRSIIDLAGSLSTLREIHFIPFHNLGKKKYTMLDMPYQYSHVRAVEQKELIEYIQYAQSKGISTRIGG